jgi:hypothetical protein
MTAHMCRAGAVRPSHLGEVFTILQRRLAGRPSGFRGRDALALHLASYTAESVSGIVVDPHDGRRYELILRPFPDRPESPCR